MRDEPQVSVVIPTFNRARSVVEAVESVLAQTYRGAEVIVVDDGSTDDTSAVLTTFGGRIRVIRQENGGVSSARNAGVLAARAPWVAFLDSDDLWMPEKLELQLREVEACGQHVVGHFVDARMDTLDGGVTTLFEVRGLVKKYANQPFLERPLLDVLIAQFFTPTWFVRRETLIRSGLFNASFRIYEDFELLTKCALQGPFIVSTECLVRVQRVPCDQLALSNLHTTRRPEALGNLVRIYCGLISSRELVKGEAVGVLEALSGARADLAMAEGCGGRPSLARAYARQSFRDNRSIKALLRACLIVLAPKYAARFVGGFHRFTRRGQFRRSAMALGS